MIINIKEEMTCRRRTHNFMASPCHPLFGRVTILGMIIKKKKLYYVNRPYLWIETKSLPNYEFKWKQENFPLIHVPLSISCKWILKLNWSSTFLPIGEQDWKVKYTPLICANYKANQKEIIECIARSSIEQKKLKFMLTCL